MTSPRVAILTRYPEPGCAKTRLIPALGAQGAAALHRRLVERTLAAVRASGLPHRLHVTGAPAAAFNDWLGPVEVVEQGDGDLGQRLARAGPPYPTLFIGTDAPDLDAALLMRAAGALASHAAVVGPAQDGGYWLLGLCRAVDAVFRDVPWSTDAVFARTMARLTAAGIEPALLPCLADCDRPDDLARWPDLLA